jgi:hypothetical protein
MGNFFADGFGELRRRLERFKLRRRIQQHDAERTQAFAALGERAWEKRVDLAAFPAEAQRLSGLDSRAGELTQTSSKLGSEKAALEEERRAEARKFEARRRVVENLQTPVDAALRVCAPKKAAAEEATRQGERLPGIDAELAALERDSTSPGRTEATIAAAKQRRARLAAEQGEIRGRLESARAELPALGEEYGRLTTQSRELAQQLAAIVLEERAALARIDAALGKTRSGLETASQGWSAVHRERTEAFSALGGKLYEARTQAPDLSAASGRVAAIDDARGQTDAAIGASMSETRALPPATMAKFWGVAVGIPLVLVLGIVGLQAWKSRAAPDPTATATALDPELELTRTVEQFVKSGKGAEEAKRILRNDLVTVGATADPAHLPMLASVAKSKDAGLRAAALEAMAMIGPTTAQTPLLLASLKDSDPRVVKAAREALKDSFDPTARAAASP